MFSADEIIDIAIQIEQNGEALCRKVLQKENMEPALTLLFEWMAEQEAQHIKWFSTLKGNVRTTGGNAKLEQMGKALLYDVIGDQSFSLGDADFSKIESIEDLLSLLIEFEKDTVLFYEMLRSAIEDTKTLSYLDKIIAEENQHVQQIQNYLKDGSTKKSFSPD